MVGNANFEEIRPNDFIQIGDDFNLKTFSFILQHNRINGFQDIQGQIPD